MSATEDFRPSAQFLKGLMLPQTTRLSFTYAQNSFGLRIAVVSTFFFLVYTQMNDLFFSHELRSIGGDSKRTSNSTKKIQLPSVQKSVQQIKWNLRSVGIVGTLQILQS
ncbi:hypothetical protein DMUE_2931 [Dictyocoela muelleri]|nr:hypothetical protein DMUE_2931 [Dictyocoela muelleri]